MNNAPLFDEERVQELVDIIGIAGYERLLDILWNDLPQHLEKLLQNQEQNNLTGVSQMIHTLRGSLSNLGFNTLGSILTHCAVNKERIENFKNKAAIAYDAVKRKLKS
jgi:HPt (histidine-containing phosphotransfer) domain-containing protein